MNFQERYQYNPQTDFIGKGGFARVYKAHDVLLDRDVAIKIFNATEKGHYTVINEIKKAIRLQHPNLLRYYDVAVVENKNTLGETDVYQIGVMELANAGDLKEFTRKNPHSPLIFRFLKEILSGLEYLHQKGIIHRDLKPQNILLVEEDGEITTRISDFGISKDLDSNTASSSMAIGTIEYMAPEQFSPGKYGINGKISTNLDLWSFGILVHELFAHEPLFGQRSGNTTAEQIMSAILASELPNDLESLEEPYRTVVRRCLVRDAKERIQKASEILKILGENSVTSQTETVMMPRPISAVETTLAVAPEAIESVLTPAQEIKQNQNSKSNTNRRLIWLILAVILVVSGVRLFQLFNTNEGNSDYRRYQIDIPSLKELMARKSYHEVVNSLQRFMTIMMSDTTESSIENSSNIYSKRLPTSSYTDLLPMYALATLYSGDTLNAVNWLKRGAKFGNSDCAYEYGYLCFQGRFVPLDLDLAKDFFEKAASGSDGRGEAMLGNMYFMGKGVKKSFFHAFSYYEAAASKNNSVAMYALGLAAATGTGVEKNETEAVIWLDKVIEKNDNPDAVKAAKQLRQSLSL